MARKRWEKFSLWRGEESARSPVVERDGYLSQARESVAWLHDDSDLLIEGRGEGAIEDYAVL